MKYGMTDSLSDEDIKSAVEEKARESYRSGSPILVAMSSKSSIDSNAVVFSIQFYGKTIGEVGLMDPDLSQLDWKKFKEYLFQNLLSTQNQENISVMYSDEEGDKLPIECDEEYQEALKVAKRKAESNDKLVLDISRHGRPLPTTVLNVATSAIKRISSSPPKDGGISFFKHSTSPPKENRSSLPPRSVGAERKLFPGFFLHNKGPVPGHVQGLWEGDCDEALEFSKAPSSTTAAATNKITTTTATLAPASSPQGKKPGPHVRLLQNTSPGILFQAKDWSSSSISESYRVEGCSSNFSQAPHSSSAEHCKKSFTSVRQKTFPYTTEGPPPWFIAYMENFRSSLSDEVVEKVYARMENQPYLLGAQQQQQQQTGSELIGAIKEDKNILQTNTDVIPFNLKEQQTFDPKEEDSQEHNETDEKKESDSRKDKVLRKKKEKYEESESSAKRKKLTYEEEKLTRKIDKMEKAERKKIGMKYQDELDKATRTQEKVLAKMEGLRKKQSCSPEELNKLRKMVDKHNSRVSAQIRRNERKMGSFKQGRNKKINIDNKAFPVDASLLHTALQELEVLAEDSPSDSSGGAATRGFDATYLYDVTIPDGSLVNPGQEFVKTWKVNNSGVIPWNEKTMLCKWSQVHFCGSPAGWKLKPNMKKVICPALEPGQEGEISITFIAPSEPGWYATHWRFCQRGRVFGNQMWCAVRVTDGKSDEELNQTVETTVENVSTVENVTETVNALDISCDLTEVIVEKPKSTEDLLKETEPIIDGSPVLNPTSSRQNLVDLLDDLQIHCEQQAIKDTPPVNEESKVTDSLSLLEISDCEVMREAGSDKFEVNIVENYYDADSSPQQDCEVSHQGLNIIEKIGSYSKECNPNPLKDLISFEEEAEILTSGSSTPEIIEASSQLSVMSLKDIASESLEQWRENVCLNTESQETQSDDSDTFEDLVKVPCDLKSLARELDVMSLSSESCSELDSEDQAIMNESDSEGSDQEYYMINVPDCFNMDQPFNGLIISYGTDNENPSPTDEGFEGSYFLADQEEKKTTSIANNNETLPFSSLKESDILGKDNFILNKLSDSSDKSCTTEEGSNSEPSGASVAIPEPVTDDTNPLIFFKIQQDSSSEVKDQCSTDDGSSVVDSTTKATLEISSSSWGTGPKKVVCHQPHAAAQNIDGKSSTRSSALSELKSKLLPASSEQEMAPQRSPAAMLTPTTEEQSTTANVTQLGSLPEELESIIPEDLVRGAWNTARSFITRINKEMLSPGEDLEYGPMLLSEDNLGDQTSTSTLARTLTNQSQQFDQRDYSSKSDCSHGDDTTPVQQLADMGFVNLSVNERLLSKYDNNVSKAVAELIVLNHR